MSAIVQISDTHFGTEVAPVVEALIDLVSRIRPAAVVLSGDITQRARRSQFAAARRFVERLNVAAVLAIPGNHDIPLFNFLARVWYPYRGFARAFGNVLEPEFRSDAFFVVCVNTTRPSRHKDGEVSQQQIEQVAQRLRAANGHQVRIVVTHQPVHVLRTSEVHNRLHGYDPAVRAWAAAGADLILGGHIHLPYIAPLHEHFAGLARRAWIVQAGTAISSRIRRRHPNSINIIERRDDGFGCRVERWDYRAQSAIFELAASEDLQLDRG